MDDKDTGWKYQLSWKLGFNNNQMLNVRADNPVEFMEALGSIKEACAEILTAANLFAPTQQPLPIADARAVPPPAPAPTPKAVETNGSEIGPLLLEKLEVSEGVGKSSGKPYTRYITHFQGGFKANTFDTLVAGVAKNLIGKPCMVKAHKTEKFGYDLDSVRPA